MTRHGSPAVCYAMVERGARLIDVRAPEEFADGHPKDAQNVPFTRFREGRLVDDPLFLAAILDSCSLHQSLALVCRSGARATKAATLLEGAGYTDIWVVIGGYEGTRGPFGEVVDPGWRRLELP